MGHARLKAIRVKGFRSFAEESEIQLPESGMVLFRGSNLDTGGSSGSGKSSLLLAISYLFGFCRFPATALQTWLTQEPLEVVGVVGLTEGELTISRGVATGLRLTLNGKKIPGSSKTLEEKMTQFLGLAPDLLSALTYRGQKQPGLFLSKTDAEKKEFLTQLLDLGRFETIADQSQQVSKTLESKLAGDSFYAAKLAAEVKTLTDSFKPALLQDEARLRGDLALAESATTRIQGQVQSLRQSLRAAEDRIEAGVRQIQAESASQVFGLTQKVRELQVLAPDTSMIDRSALAKLQQELSQAQGFLKEELEKDQGRYRTQRNHADSVYTQLMLLEKKLAARPGIERRLVQLKGEIDKLEASLCPTCMRLWDEAMVKKVELVQERDRLGREHLEIESLRPQIALLQDEYKALGNFVPSPILEELRAITASIESSIAYEGARLDGEMALLQATQKQKVAAAEAEVQQVQLATAKSIEIYRANQRLLLDGDQDMLESLERELSMADAHVRGINAALGRVQMDNAREADREESARERLEQVQRDLAKAQADEASQRQALNAELDFQKLVGREGFLGAIFDEVLWEISEETNRLLAQFPNTAHVTLNFRSESTTGKGTIKKSIAPVVTIGGFEAPLSAGLSGGMETAVELAVDLAVATVVSRRTGAVPGWLILDESFSGLGPVEAEASMEILRAFAENKLVLVVDHASEFKSLFSQFVDVKYRNGFSRAEMANV